MMPIQRAGDRVEPATSPSVSDVNGNVFSPLPSTIIMHVEGGPTYPTFACDIGQCGSSTAAIAFNLSLLASGRLVGTFYEVASPSRRVDLNLGKS